MGRLSPLDDSSESWRSAGGGVLKRLSSSEGDDSGFDGRLEADVLVGMVGTTSVGGVITGTDATSS